MCICGTVERELKMKTSKCVTIERNLYPHIHTHTYTQTQSSSNEALKKRAEAAV